MFRKRLGVGPFLAFLLVASVLVSERSAAADSSNAIPVSRLEGSIRWYDIRQLGVEGRAWSDTKAFYDRLPARAEGKVRKPVWDLSRNSAGLCVRFVTDATTIHARWALTESWLYLPNSTAIAKSGLDLYVKTDRGQWRWLAVGAPDSQPNTVKPGEHTVPGTVDHL